MDSRSAFLAARDGSAGKIGDRGRKPTYRAFQRILNGELHADAYRYSADLKIRFKSHVLPDTHQLFRIMTPLQLIALEVLGPPPLDRPNCCGKWFAQIPIGDCVEDLRYESDHFRLLRHRRACLSRMVRERPHGEVRRRASTLRASTRHVGDDDNWGSTPEEIPLLGMNERGRSLPKTCDSQRNSRNVHLQ